MRVEQLINTEYPYSANKMVANGGKNTFQYNKLY